MRTVKRRRRYVGKHVIMLVRPVFRYSKSRHAYVLRVVGRRYGPVLRLDRRHGSSWEGTERRGGRAKVA